jgi:DNA-binding beta-propeller fold protein YncE
MRQSRSASRSTKTLALVAMIGPLALLAASATGQPQRTLSTSFERRVLVPPGEAPFGLRLFITAAKTDSRGRIITGLSDDPVKRLVGAEPAGERAGLQRFTKIMFGADYFDGRADPGTRIDPDHPAVKSGKQHWPFVPQPFRGMPTELALTPDGGKLYVSLPGREGFPDSRVAVVDTDSRRVLTWIELRPAGVRARTRPVGVKVSPANSTIASAPYVVVLHEYGNFASVIDTATDRLLGEFETGFYAEDLVFGANGTRLYVTDRFRDQVRVFRIDPGPFFTQIAAVPTGRTALERANPRDLDLSSDGRTLYVANTLGHTVAVIDVADDANRLVGVLPVGGLATDVKVAGRWGIVSGHDTSNVLNGPESGHGLPKVVGGAAIRNTGAPLGYTPVMTDATQATAFDDMGSTLSVFDTTTQQFVFRYVDEGRDLSLVAVPGEVFDLGDHPAAEELIRGSGPEQIAVKGDFVFVTQLHSDKVEVFRVNQAPSSPSEILTRAGIEFTGGITPQGIAVSPDGRTAYVANLQTEDVSFLRVDADGNLTRDGHLAVGVTNTTPDPTTNGKGKNLFATHEEIGLRWFFTQSYSDDGQKSCAHCHWQSRHDGSQWNVAANAIGGPKAVPQNKDLSDNWPEWFEGLNNDMTAYASACNGELNNAEQRTALFPQPDLRDRLKARDEFVKARTAENSVAIGRPELSGKAFSIGFYDMAFAQILWTQNEVRRLPNPARQAPTAAEAAQLERGRFLFMNEPSAGGSGCASCHVNGNRLANGLVNVTTQDYNIHEPGVVSETTVGGDGPFLRPANDYVFKAFEPPQDLGSRQNISSRNTKHLRSFWDSVPRWLHHGGAHTVREILLAPDSPLLAPGERGFNFRTVRTDHSRTVAHDFLGGPPIALPTEVPITLGHSGGGLAGDGMGPIFVSLDAPVPVGPPDDSYPEGRLFVDQLGTANAAPLIVESDGQRRINPRLANEGVAVIRDTHGRTSHLSAEDVAALEAYLLSLE